jgi:hypothetical protein
MFRYRARRTAAAAAILSMLAIGVALADDDKPYLNVGAEMLTCRKDAFCPVVHFDGVRGYSAIDIIPVDEMCPQDEPALAYTDRPNAKFRVCVKEVTIEKKDAP